MPVIYASSDDLDKTKSLNFADETDNFRILGTKKEPRCCVAALYAV